MGTQCAYVTLFNPATHSALTFAGGNATQTLTRPWNLQKQWLRIFLPNDANLDGGKLTVNRIDRFGRATEIWNSTGPGETLRRDSGWASLQLTLTGSSGAASFTVGVECSDDSDFLEAS